LIKSENEVRRMVELICSQFDTPFPAKINYTWRGKGENGCAFINGRTKETSLRLPIHSWVGIEQLVCHEVSHLIEWQKFGCPLPHKSHGEPFTQILLEVAKFVKQVYGFEYNFSIEYPQVSKAAGVKTIPYGTERKKIKLLNTAKLLGCSEDEVKKLLEGIK
jgi:predicted SprT family Zn-dependent metalloprotease